RGGGWRGAAAEEQRDRERARRVPAPVRRRVAPDRAACAAPRGTLGDALSARVLAATGGGGALGHHHGALGGAAAPVRRPRRVGHAQTARRWTGARGDREARALQRRAGARL